jgi:hypothetical protein
MEIGGLMGICFWDIEGISKRDDTTVMFGVVRKWKTLQMAILIVNIC